MRIMKIILRVTMMIRMLRVNRMRIWWWWCWRW